MAYNNQNNGERKSTNTRSATIANSKTIMTPILLETSFWDDMLKLVFYPELPESQRTENRRFDRDHGTLTCLSRDKCNELANVYRDEIKPKLDDKTSPKEDAFYSVTVAGVNQVGIGIKVGEDGEYHGYISLIKDIDPDTLISNNVTEFEFPKGEYVVNYNPADGSFGERRITHNGIDVFCHDLEDFRRASGKAYIHAARCVDRAFKDMMYGGIVAIGEKVGAAIQTAGVGNSKYGRTNQESLFDRDGGSSAPMNIPTMTLDELEQSLANAEGAAK